MSKAFDTVNIHKLINKFKHTNLSNTVAKFIANYIKERKAYTTSTQHQFKSGIPQMGVPSPTLFNIYTLD